MKAALVRLIGERWHGIRLREQAGTKNGEPFSEYWKEDWVLKHASVRNLGYRVTSELAKQNKTQKQKQKQKPL